MDPRIDPGLEHLDLIGRLGPALLDFMDDLTVAYITGSTGAEDIKSKYVVAINGLTKCSFRNLCEVDGAFIISGEEITFDLNPILDILFCVVDQVKSIEEKKGLYLDPTEIVAMQEDAVIIYCLHELRHISQGLATKSHVVEMTSVSGKEKLAELDIVADRDAMSAYAFVKSGGNDTLEYLDYFSKALYYSISIFLNVFNFSIDRLDKFSRAAGLVLMQSRFAMKELGLDYGKAALDSTIVVRFGASMDMNIFIKCPDERYLAKISANDNRRFVRALEEQDFNEAVQAGVGILNQLKAL